MKKIAILLSLILTGALCFGQNYTQDMLDSASCTRQWDGENWVVRIYLQQDSIQDDFVVVSGTEGESASTTKASAETAFLSKAYAIKPTVVTEEL
ncbi:MAG: hypothetical protein ACQ9ET_00010 [Nitrosomonadaceae bacterium]